MFEFLIVKPIFNALMALYSLIPGGDFGIAIIIFTVLIRFLLYPLVKSQLHQTKAMRKLQPELKKIKQAANGNRQLEAAQQMELYKKYGINPFRSILILIIQLPIFIGLYQVIQVVTLHRDQLGRHMYEATAQLEPVKKIIENPDNFNHTMLGFIDLTKTTFGNHGVDITLLALAVISAVTQYIMTKQTAPTNNSSKKFREIMAEAASGKQSDPSEMSGAMMGSMMKIMPVFMFFIMVSLPGALALYYTVSNLVAVAQQHYLLSKDSEELEDIGDEPTIVHNTSNKKAIKASKATKANQPKEAHITRITAKDTRKVKRR
jgi:YidC/Oxa1 family membrane protein insertase